MTSRSSSATPLQRTPHAASRRSRTSSSASRWSRRRSQARSPTATTPQTSISKGSARRIISRASRWSVGWGADRRRSRSSSRDADDQRRVLKVAADPDRNDRIRDEAEVLSKLRDRTIIAIQGEPIEIGAHAAVVLAYASEGTLAHRLRRDGRLLLETLDTVGRGSARRGELPRAGRNPAPRHQAREPRDHGAGPAKAAPACPDGLLALARARRADTCGHPSVPRSVPWCAEAPPLGSRRRPLRSCDGTPRDGDRRAAVLVRGRAERQPAVRRGRGQDRPRRVPARGRAEPRRLPRAGAATRREGALRHGRRHAARLASDLRAPRPARCDAAPRIPATSRASASSRRSRLR